MKIYKCEHCKNVMMYMDYVGVDVKCCGEKMVLVNENSTDAAVEKHVPKISIANGELTVCVGDVLHPMTEPHLINFIAYEDGKDLKIKYLDATDEPVAVFPTSGKGKVYAYCNLHGLWVKEL